MFAKARTGEKQVTPRIRRLIFTLCTGFHPDFIRTDLRGKKCCFGSRSLRTFGVSPRERTKLFSRLAFIYSFFFLHYSYSKNKKQV